MTAEILGATDSAILVFNFLVVFNFGFQLLVFNFLLFKFSIFFLFPTSVKHRCAKKKEEKGEKEEIVAQKEISHAFSIADVVAGEGTSHWAADGSGASQVHLLHEDRGAVLEAVVARTNRYSESLRRRQLEVPH